MLYIKNKVSQSMIDAVNGIINETKSEPMSHKDMVMANAKHEINRASESAKTYKKNAAVVQKHHKSLLNLGYEYTGSHEVHGDYNTDVVHNYDHKSGSHVQMVYNRSNMHIPHGLDKNHEGRVPSEHETIHHGNEHGIVKIMQSYPHTKNSPHPHLTEGVKLDIDLIEEKHDDEKEDKALVKKLVKKDCLTKEETVTEKSCWKGYEKKGTKMKSGKEVNNCVAEGKLDDLRDKQQMDIDSGKKEKPKKKVADFMKKVSGKAYGGSKQKDEPEKMEESVENLEEKRENEHDANMHLAAAAKTGKVKLYKSSGALHSSHDTVDAAHKAYSAIPDNKGYKIVREEIIELEEGKLDDLRDKQQMDIDSGKKQSKKSEPKSLKKILGKAYGGSKQKDEPEEVKEEIEQIDELSKQTMVSYVKKASVDAANKAAKAQHTNGVEKAFKTAKAMKRLIGVSDAASKLSEENIETLEEGEPAFVKGKSKHNGPAPVGTMSSDWSKGGKFHDIIKKRKEKEKSKEENIEEKVNDKKKSTDTLAGRVDGDTKNPFTKPKIEINNEEKKEDVPFNQPYKKVLDDVKDKSGAHHTAMSRVKHLAKMAAQKVKSK